MTDSNNKWYVVYTRPRWEKKVAATLLEKGIHHYCPLNKRYRQWTDRTKVVYEPLFKGYIFVHLPEAQKWDLKLINGIVNYIYWLGRPAVVREEEIDTIRKFLQEFEEVEVSDTQLDVNDPVIVKQGLLMDYKGIIVEIKGNKARVNIESMGISLTALFDTANLHPVNSQA